MSVQTYKARWTVGTVGTFGVMAFSVYLWMGHNDWLYGIREGLIALIIAAVIASGVSKYSKSENIAVAAYIVIAAAIVLYLSTGTSPNEERIITIYEKALDPAHVDLKEVCAEGPDKVIRCKPHGL